MNSFLDKYCPGFRCVLCKPHPFENKHPSIADGLTEEGHEGKPIMWHAKIQEKKDCQKKENGRWAFPSKFCEYTKRATVMLETMEPINHTDKVVFMDSGLFCT
jgi:hypothetical protein